MSSQIATIVGLSSFHPWPRCPVSEVSLEASSFLCAFATVAGGVSPGGLGVADAMLVTAPMQLLGLPEPEVLAVSMLIRTATLWTGVLMGAFALLLVGRLLARPRAVR